jgi:glycosyltransferase involved in cell wall biosynthesis
MMKSLFLSLWYPHRYDAMAGLFVQKHAEALNLYCDVKVLFVYGDKHIKSFEIVDRMHNDLNEITVYYPIKNPSNVFYKPLKALNYIRAYKKGYAYLASKGFFPDIVHVNMLTRTGFMAYIYKIWKKTPYVITEQWTRYLPANASYKGFIRKKLTEIVVRNASAVMPVSSMLRQAMLNHNLKNLAYKVIDNVVSEPFFEDSEKKPRNIKRFLHVSCFIERAKNVCGILDATRMLSNERNDFELIIIGTGPDFQKCISHYQSLNFPENTVRFIGEKTPQEVAQWFHDSDVFILFSNYETAGAVVAESLASGTPVIATPTGIVPDAVNETNGVIVDFRDTHALMEKMNFVLDNLAGYDSAAIREEAMKFNYRNAGKKIYEVYTQVVG